MGNVIHYFWRREYQARGVPHIHGKLWIENAPIVGRELDEDVLKFILKYLFCKIPDVLSEPRLHEMVMSYQYHRCTRSCQRVIYIKGRWVIICRYGFPKETNATGSLNSIAQTLQSRLRGRKIKRLCNLPRNLDEKFINDYNSLLLLLWEGNIDIQYVGETSMSLDRYITRYITKPETNATNQLWEECNQNKSLHSRIKSFSLKSFMSREIGIYEIIDKLLGFVMCEFSEKVEFLATDQSKDRRR